MEKRIEKLLQHYKALEKQFKIIDATQTYSSLVTASTNRQYPVQRWFHFKEAYSLDLLDTLLSDWKIKQKDIKRVLDPFCGTGTSLLSIQKLAKKSKRNDLYAVGFERNPFLHFVAQTKSKWQTFDSQSFEVDMAYLLNGIPKSPNIKIPELSTLHREDVFKKEKIFELLEFKNAINLLSENERKFFLLGYASVLEDLSGARKDGRMIRIVKNKRMIKTSAALQTSWSSMIDDVKSASQIFCPIETDVFLGDGRKLVPEYFDKSLDDFDLLIYSPPYLNNIDYSEVYKIELWMSGFVNSSEEFKALRHKTFRSHPSIKFLDPISFKQHRNLDQIHSTLEKLTGALPYDKDRKWRTDLFNGYFDDMYQSLVNQKRVMKEGGWIFCVVGNSLHCSDKEPNERVPVASDLIIASIAKAIGLKVKAIQVARYLNRRGPDGHLLRESIVVMKKPYSQI